MLRIDGFDYCLGDTYYGETYEGISIYKLLLKLSTMNTTDYISSKDGYSYIHPIIAEVVRRLALMAMDNCWYKQQEASGEVYEEVDPDEMPIHVYNGKDFYIPHMDMFFSDVIAQILLTFNIRDNEARMEHKVYQMHFSAQTVRDLVPSDTYHLALAIANYKFHKPVVYLFPSVILAGNNQLKFDGYVKLFKMLYSFEQQGILPNSKLLDLHEVYRQANKVRKAMDNAEVSKATFARVVVDAKASIQNSMISLIEYFLESTKHSN